MVSSTSLFTQSIRSIMPPRFQRIRRSRLTRALKWLFTHPFFWAAVIIIIVLNWGAAC
jgi:hypothetical protein